VRTSSELLVCGDERTICRKMGADAASRMAERVERARAMADGCIASSFKNQSNSCGKAALLGLKFFLCGAFQSDVTGYTDVLVGTPVKRRTQHPGSNVGVVSA
jgi:uncharacterized protein YbbK (DUF523 family)